MEGLEAVEMKLSEVLSENDSFRFDSEYFKKEFIDNERMCFNFCRILDKVVNNLPIVKGLKLSKKINYLEISGINKNSSYEFDTISHIGIPSRADCVLKHNDIAVSTVRPVRNSVAFIRHPNRLVGSSGLTVLRVANDIFPEYMLVFCKTNYFVTCLNRRTTATMYPAVSDSDVLNTKLFMPTFDFQEAIKCEVEKLYFKLDSSKSLYTQAETLLLETLGMADFNSSAESVNIKSFKDSFGATGRLDAEYYQPKYEQLEAIIAQNHVLGSLENLLTLNRRGSQPNYAEQGLPVINSKHVREGNVVLSDNRYAVLAEKENTLIIQKNDVLVNGTGVGTIGRAAPYLHDEPALPDNHVTILRTDKINPIFLSVYLNSIAGKYQVDKYFKGSSGQIELYPDDINCFYVPLVDNVIQTKIADLVQQSFALKKESEQLLEIAKQAVELAIEQGEDVAMDFLNDLTKRID